MRLIKISNEDLTRIGRKEWFLGGEREGEGSYCCADAVAYGL